MDSLNPRLAEQFDDNAQQKNASSLGMMTFIATEVLFFGTLFLIYTVYRSVYSEQFEEAARELNIYIGTINTAILLLSSFFMAIAVSLIAESKTKSASISLIITWFLGLFFLLLKAYEYYQDIEKHIVVSEDVIIQGESSRIARMFYFIYYIVTGVHALHLTIGLGVLFVIIIQTCRKKFSKNYFTPVELTGLYWHFVDIIWIFLYPLLYLIGRDL